MIDQTMLPPPVMQASGSTDCGLCAVKYILNRFGRDADLEHLRSSCRWGQDGRRGTEPHDLFRVLADHGLTGMWPYQFREAEPPMPRNLPPDLRTSDPRIHSVLVERLGRFLVEGWVGFTNRRLTAAMGHFVVVDAIDPAGHLLITCSLQGRRWWTSEEFFGGWDGQGDGGLWWLFRKEAA